MENTLNTELRDELLAMQHADESLRDELANSGALVGHHYVPAMQAIHEANAARLTQILDTHGWPHDQLVGPEGAYAAWLIVQHSIGDPPLQRCALALLERESLAQKVPAWQAAYLADRIAMYEGRPQRYGTQSLDDPRDGLSRPWLIKDPLRVDALRASVGLAPLPPIPAPGPDLPAAQQASLRENESWWKSFLASRGWPLTP
jgi:hypothetical protein